MMFLEVLLVTGTSLQVVRILSDDQIPELSSILITTSQLIFFGKNVPMFYSGNGNMEALVYFG